MGQSLSREYLTRIVNDWDFYVDECFRQMKWPKQALTAYERAMFHDMAFGHPRRVICAPRGIGKTYGVTMLATWRLRRDRNRRIIIVNYNDKYAGKTLFLIREMLESLPFLQDLAPKGQDVDNRLSFNVHGASPNRQPSVSVGSINASLESMRAHSIFFDDVETKKNVITVEGRETLKAQTNEGTNIIYPASTDAVDAPEIIVTQTPKHDESIVRTFKDRGFNVFCYPLLVPAEGEPGPYILAPAAERLMQGLAPGTLLVPRFSPAEVAERRAAKHEFWREQQQAVSLGGLEERPLSLSDLIVYDFPPPPGKLPLSVSWGTSNNNGSTKLSIPCLGFGNDALHGPIFVDKEFANPFVTKAAIDPSGKGKDKTGIAIGSTLGGMVFVHLVDGLPGGVDEPTIEKLVLLLKQYRVQEVVFEKNFDTTGIYQQTLETLIHRHHAPPGDPLFPEGWTCRVEGIHSTRNKEDRIITSLQSIMGSHRLVMHPQTLRPDLREEDSFYNELQYQIANIKQTEKRDGKVVRSVLREDGKIDALAMLVTALQQFRRLEPALQRQTAIERDLDRERPITPGPRAAFAGRSDYRRVRH